MYSFLIHDDVTSAAGARPSVSPAVRSTWTGDWSEVGSDETARNDWVPVNGLSAGTHWPTPPAPARRIGQSLLAVINHHVAMIYRPATCLSQCLSSLRRSRRRFSHQNSRQIGAVSLQRNVQTSAHGLCLERLGMQHPRFSFHLGLYITW